MHKAPATPPGLPPALQAVWPALRQFVGQQLLELSEEERTWLDDAIDAGAKLGVGLVEGDNVLIVIAPTDGPARRWLQLPLAQLLPPSESVN